jgi:hypothetical protein
MLAALDTSGHPAHRADRAHRDRSARSFGLLMMAVFAFVGCRPLLRHGEIRGWALALAVAFLVSALAAPRVLVPLDIAWRRLGELLGRVTNPIVLAVLYFAVVTPFGLLMRLVRRSPLDLVRDPAATTYWTHRQSEPGKPGQPGHDSMREQF